jgi:hypothetical protein
VQFDEQPSLWCVQYVKNIVPTHVHGPVKGFEPIQSVSKVVCIQSASAPLFGSKTGCLGCVEVHLQNGPTLIQMQPNLEGGCNTQYNVKWTGHTTCIDPWQVH